MIEGCPIFINGEGQTSRYFCYVSNVVQANILAATHAKGHEVAGDIFNVAVGDRTTLNTLSDMIFRHLQSYFPNLREIKPSYQDFRSCDVMHSQADITKAKTILGYEPEYKVSAAFKGAIPWYIQLSSKKIRGPINSFMNKYTVLNSSFSFRGNSTPRMFLIIRGN